MITLVGVGHVFKLAREIKEFILSSDPDVIAVELDRNKLANALGKKLARAIYSREDPNSPEPSRPETSEKENPDVKGAGEETVEELPDQDLPEPRDLENVEEASPMDTVFAEQSQSSIQVTVSVGGEEQVFSPDPVPDVGNWTVSTSAEPADALKDFDYHSLLDAKGNARFLILNPRTQTPEPFNLRKKDVERFFMETSRKGVPLMYRLAENIQNTPATENEVMAGDEMLAALECGWVTGKRLSLIDVNTAKLLQKINKEMSVFEKGRFFLSTFTGMVRSKGDITDELFKFEADHGDYMDEFAKKFPVLKRELIDNRNRFMADNLLALSQHYPHVLAVVGEGHIEGIKEILLEELPAEELREKRLFDFQEFRKLKKKNKEKKVARESHRKGS